MSGTTVWSYDTSARPGSVTSPAPSQAVRLKNGDTLISDQFNHQVIEVTQAGDILWSYGQIGVPGNAAGISTHPTAPRSSVTTPGSRLRRGSDPGTTHSRA